LTPGAASDDQHADHQNQATRGGCGFSHLTCPEVIPERWI
jgi:hypothetical protein